MARETAIVIGAGMGGLACAIDLARAGLKVIVLDKAAEVGGKMREICVGGARVDSGPTVLTLREVFEDLFADAGADFAERVTLTPATILARHAWSEDERLDLFADRERSAEAIGEFAGAREAAGYRAFCDESARIHGVLRDTFLKAQRPGPLGLTARVGFAKLPELMAIKPFHTLWRALGQHFADPRLRQLFGRFATYCGSSPFAAPATLMLIAHVEQEGVWLVEGGMQRLAEAMARLAEEVGVTIRRGARVASVTVEGGRVRGVTLADGERLEADWVAANTDPGAIAGGAFGSKAARAGARVPFVRRSLSAISWSARARTAGWDLCRHNVIFSRDYAAEFREIFQEGRPPRSPTVYVCAQDRGDDRAAPSGEERLLILVNAPPLGDRREFGSKEVAECETEMIGQLARCGLSLSLSDARITTPTDFEALFPGTGGALYGPAMHGWAAAFRRPAARTRVERLYLTGGGVHPGSGVPMAVLSGRLAAEAILKDRGSTRRFPGAAMSGGTSTPSPTMARAPSPSSSSSAACSRPITPGAGGPTR